MSVTTPPAVHRRQDHVCGAFSAMASPCELLFDTTDEQLACRLTTLAEQETRRIEQKFSRYRDDNVLWRINHSNGMPVAIDDETARLLSFANTCYDISDGMFDITSGVLRKAWQFDGSDTLPSPDTIDALLPHIGWQQVSLESDSVTLPTGFELDLGGIGKEYAVDAVARLLQQHAPGLSVLVNFGGDIQVTARRQHNAPWLVGIEDPDSDSSASRIVKIHHGGLATSGDSRRFLLKDGVRYSHILNPKTGWPVAQAPRSVTVASEHCIQAGLLATLALLHGPQAEAFLQQQDVTHWVYR